MNTKFTKIYELVLCVQVAGCVAVVEPTENEVATETNDLQLVGVQDWSLMNAKPSLTACWMTDDEFYSGLGSGLRSTDETNAINQIQKYIESGWLSYSSVAITWKSHCTTFKEDLRIYFDDTTLLSPVTQGGTNPSWPHNAVGGRGPLEINDETGNTLYWHWPPRTGIVPGSFTGVCSLDQFLDSNGVAYGGSRGAFPSWRAPGGIAENCLYNMYIQSFEFNGGGVDSVLPGGGHVSTPFVAHYLHEFGHAIGMEHEHARTDDPPCKVAEVNDAVYLTDYDLGSVMHYSQKSPNGCRTDGNYSQHGLSQSDELGVEMLYPLNALADAPIVGGTLFRDDQTATFSPRWVANGAYLGLGGRTGAFYRSFSQRVTTLGGTVKASSSASDVSVSTSSLGVGTFVAKTAFDDVLSRHWTGASSFRVVTKADYTAIMAPILFN